jgi:sodium/proline symporter
MVLDPVLLTFGLYLGLMLFIGWLGFRATHDFSDYILGGRHVGGMVSALSAGASDMSAWLLMGLPGAVWVSGLSAAWIAVGVVIGAWLNWQLVAARLRIASERADNALTLPAYLAHRFDDTHHTLRILSALVILLFFTLYCASGVVAGARLFETLFGLDYTTACWAGSLCTLAYVFLGGFFAVSWTDALQATLMLFALLLVPLVAWSVLPPGDLAGLAQEAARTRLNPFNGMSVLGICSLLAWGLGYFGQPHILVRFMAIEGVASVPRAARINVIWMVLCLLGAVGVGLFGQRWSLAHPELAAPVLGNPETIFLVLARELFPAWLGGMLLAAILAAVMSTLSCQLLICSSALTEDLYRKLLRRAASQRELVLMGRAMVLLVTLCAIVLAGDPDSRVLAMVSYAWAGFGASFGPVILLSLWWPRMTHAGALGGILVGAATVVLWKHFSPWPLYEIVPGFLASTLTVLGVSRLTYR